MLGNIRKVGQNVAYDVCAYLKGRQQHGEQEEEQLKQHTIDNEQQAGLTTNQGLKMAEDEFSLKAGRRDRH